MNNSLLIFELSGWWIALAVIVSGGIAFLTYQKPNLPWSQTTSFLLGTTRFLGLFFVFLLILNPLINQVENTTERPSIAIAVDNSSSMVLNTDSSEIIDALSAIASTIEGKGFNYEIFGLEGRKSVNEIRFDGLSTDINSQLIDIENNFEGQNLGGVVLISDGIYNRGSSPRFRNTVYPVFTLGVGDTSVIKDIAILQVNANKVAYQGNKFPIEVLLSSRGLSGSNVTIQLLQNGREIETRNIVVQENMSLQFTGEAENPGLARYEVRIAPMEGEATQANNRSTFYIEVIEGQENILVFGPSPHPDIRALRQALEKSENYSTSVYIPGINELNEDEEYDVVIVHQAYTPGLNIPEVKGDPSYWYIIGERVNIGAIANNLSTRIELGNVRRDQVRPALNQSFSKFDLESTEGISYYPTIEVPFGEYEVQGPTEILLYQRIGNVVTDKPLMSFFDDGNRRFSTLFGTGFWKWPLQEYAINGNSEGFDNLILKTIQYLSVRNDRRKFIFEPTNENYPVGEPVRFNTESYNDVYERIGGNTIYLNISDENGDVTSYEFVANRTNSTVFAGSMKEGIYDYEASTRINNTNHRVIGEFLVSNIDLEQLSLVADHKLLADISERSGGTYTSISQLETLQNEIEALELKNIIHSSRMYIPLVNLWYILMILTGMFTIEWVTRKYLGSY